MATTLTSITVSDELLREIDEATKELDWPRETLLRAAVRRLIRSERRWRELQRIGEEHARAIGVSTEDDVEEFLDALPAAE